MMASFLPMLAVGAITNFIFKLRELRKEAQRIKNIFSDYKDSLTNSGTTAEIEKIKSLHRIIQERLGTEEQIESAQLELIRLLGIEEGKQVDINEKVAERVKLLEAAARVDQAIESKLSAEKRIRGIGSKVGVRAEDINHVITRTAKALNSPAIGVKLAMEGESAKLLKAELVELMRVYGDAVKTIDKYSLEGTSTVGGGGGGGGGKGDKETPLQKAEKKYAEGILKLTNQKQAGVITTEEYNKAIDALNKTIYKEIGGILGSKSTLNETFLKAKQGVENPLITFSELGKLNDEYNKSLKALNRKQELGLITEDNYNKELLDLINATASKIASFENITDAERDYIESSNKQPQLMLPKEALGYDLRLYKSQSDILRRV